MRFSFFSALFLVSFLFSCASTPPPPSNQPEPPVEEKEQSLPPPPAFFELKCEDTTISLRPQSVSVPLFVIVSQQHCPPCKIIYRHAAELKKRFGERIQFTVIYNDDEEHQVDGLSVCHLKKDSNHLISLTNQFPRVVIFDDGGEVVADLTGVYPALYYYGVVREILTNQRVRELSK